MPSFVSHITPTTANMENKKVKSISPPQFTTVLLWKTACFSFLLLPTNTKSTHDESAYEPGRDFLEENIGSGEATGAFMHHHGEVYSHFAQAGTILLSVNIVFPLGKSKMRIISLTHHIRIQTTYNSRIFSHASGAKIARRFLCVNTRKYSCYIC